MRNIIIIFRKAMPSFFSVLQTTWLTSHNRNQTSSFLPPSPPLPSPPPLTPKEELSNVEFSSHCTLSLLPRRSRWLSLGIPMKIAIIPKKVRREAEDDGKREKAVPLTNSQNGKTMNTRNISGKLLCCKEKANQAREN